MNDRKHVFFSYGPSDEHEGSSPYLLKRQFMNKRLRVYQPKKDEDINTVIAIGIEQAAIVLVFPSSSLLNSKNASKILNYADQTKTPILTVKYDADFQPTAWLGAILAPMKTCTCEFNDVIRSMGSLITMDNVILQNNEKNGPPLETEKLFHGEHALGNISAHYTQYGKTFPMIFQFFGLGDGKIYGQGDDDVGSFILAGVYSDFETTNTGKFKFIKRYVGAHSVMYSGQIMLNGKTLRLQGQWEIQGFGDNCTFVLQLADEIHEIRRRQALAKARAKEAALVADTLVNCSRRFATKVMISYCAGQHELANKIASGLNANGIKTICPRLNMKTMIKEAASNAKVVVPLMSKTYQNSAIAKSVLSYADQAGIPIVPVKAEDPYTQTGWLGVVCAGALWTQFTNESEFSQRLHDLIGQLTPHLGTNDPSVDHEAAEVLVDGTHAMGYYVQDGTKHDMKFDMLAMIKGEIAGQGDDSVGPFILHGNYTSEGKEKLKVAFIKRYIGQHEVQYFGVATMTKTQVVFDGRWKLHEFSDVFHLEVAHTRQSGPSTSGLHVMLSYQWNSQDLVKRVADMLKERNIPIWFDIDGGMKGNINASMADGVENAAVVVSFDTVAYSKSVNCQKELTYASQLKKEIIPILLDDGKEINGTWLDMIIASLNKINMQDSKQFEANFDKVIAQIDAILALKREEAKKIHPSKKPPTRFEGGPVYGEYYQYGQPHSMSFEYFTLHDGMVSGQGQDEVGPFTMAGSYDFDGSVSFVKKYIGQHEVEYHGSLKCYPNGDFNITGKWEIPSYGLMDNFALRNKK